jgi:GMP synthase (glutamine-hydrolysing)
MKPFLLIKTGGTIPEAAVAFGDFEHWFSEALELPLVPSWAEGTPGGAASVRQVDVFRGEPLPAPSECSAALITGSAAMVSDREDWSETTGQWLLGAMEAGLPILGVCYGHQLLAQALGGVVGPNPLGRQIGTTMVTLEPAAGSDQLMCALPGAFQAQTTHMESILTLPPGVVRLATTPRDQNHVVRFNPRTWGIQFHPEFSAEVMDTYISVRSGDLRAEGLDPDHLSTEVRQTPIAYGLIPRFNSLASQLL